MSDLVTGAESGAYTPDASPPKESTRDDPARDELSRDELSREKPSPDEPLLDELSREEFQTLLVAVLPAAYGYAFRLARHEADAEDIVQEAALLAFRGLRGFTAGTNFKAWFFRIVTTCFWGRHRQQRRRPQTVDFDDTPDLYLYAQSAQNGLPYTGEDPAGRLLDKLGTERVADAIAQLPDEFAVVCTLYFMEDLAYQEIADVLEVPVGTVRSRLHRGRKMLQKTLWQAACDAGIVGSHAPAEEDEA